MNERNTITQPCHHLYTTTTTKKTRETDLTNNQQTATTDSIRQHTPPWRTDHIMPGPKKHKDIPHEQDLPQWFHDCRKRKVIEYDTTKYPFRRLMADWLFRPTRISRDASSFAIDPRTKGKPKTMSSMEGCKYA